MRKIPTRAYILSIFIITAMASCNNEYSASADSTNKADSNGIVQPIIVTDTLLHDTDDPAIWLHPTDPSKSLIFGTDKNENGGLFVFDLNGKIDSARSIKDLQRPNNIDIEYGLMLKGTPTDIAVVTERFTHKIRIYSLPDMKPIDNGGIAIFEGEKGEGFRDLMGVSLYKHTNGDVYVIVGRKTGPTDGNYLWQYLLKDDGKGNVATTLARKFGNYSGKLEIEAIAVDDRLGYIYYSDEGVGVRKYYADPAKGNQELALFATTGFMEDHEGISIYNSSDSTGFILVSDQAAHQFQIFPREGMKGQPHQHPVLRVVKVAAKNSDGSETIAQPLNNTFKKGVFVVMNDEKNFHYYLPETIIGDSLMNGIK
jgi:3-phytase